MTRPLRRPLSFLFLPISSCHLSTLSIARKEFITQLAVNLTFSYGGKTFLATRFGIKPEKPHRSVLFGPSGAGKTLLLHALAGIEPADRQDGIKITGSIDQGEIGWFDSDKKIFLSPRKRSVGLLFQDYSLFPHLTVFENIAYGLPRQTHAKKEVFEWLRRFRLEGKEHDLPGQLSGGERQRVALAQTLAPKPSLALLDEPFSALDRPTRRELLREVRNWLPNNNMSAIIVLHDLDDAICMGEEIIVLADGKVLQTGKPEEIACHPSVPTVAKTLGIENLLPAYILSASEGELFLAINRLDVEHLGTRGRDDSPDSEMVGTLCAVGMGQVGDPYYIAIRANDIMLESTVSGKSSARNHLAGRVIEVVSVGLKMAVQMDCGFPLTAHVTKRSVDELNLSPGKQVRAVIKASSIHLIPR